MIMFYQCGYPIRLAYMIFLLITIMTLILLLWRFIIEKRSIKRITVSTSVLLLLFIVYTVLLDDHIIPLDAVNWQSQQAPIPILVLWSVTVLIFICSGYAIMLDHKRTQKTVTESSIKEAINEVPLAICCFKEDGTLRLCNRKMQEISELMGSRIFMSYYEFKEILAEREEWREMDYIFRFPGGMVYRYTEDNIETVDGERYIISKFFDVTELDHRKAELERENEELRRMSFTLQKLKENVRLLAKEEEILSIKTKWHDVMGEGLTAIRRALLSNQPREVTDNTLKRWSDAVTVIQQDNDDPDQRRDDVGDLLRDALGLQIRLIMEGEIPADKETQKVFMLAARNCLVNAAQHAKATEMQVRCIQTEKEDVLSVTNNGIAPHSEIIPRGGLINVKNHAEHIGGRTEIQSSPRFELRVIVPRKE